MSGVPAEQAYTMRWVLFWLFVAMFAVITALTIALVFFGVGSGIQLGERALLFRLFLGEVGISVVALFYSAFGLQRPTTDVLDESIRKQAMPIIETRSETPKGRNASYLLNLLGRLTVRNVAGVVVIVVSGSVVYFSAQLAGDKNAIYKQYAYEIVKLQEKIQVAENERKVCKEAGQRWQRLYEDERAQLDACQSRFVPHR